MASRDGCVSLYAYMHIGYVPAPVG